MENAEEETRCVSQLCGNCFRVEIRREKNGITRALHLIMCLLGIDISLNNEVAMNVLF